MPIHRGGPHPPPPRGAEEGIGRSARLPGQYWKKPNHYSSCIHYIASVHSITVRCVFCREACQLHGKPSIIHCNTVLLCTVIYLQVTDFKIWTVFRLECYWLNIQKKLLLQEMYYFVKILDILTLDVNFVSCRFFFEYLQGETHRSLLGGMLKKYICSW